MTIYNPTILVAGVQLLVMLTTEPASISAQGMGMSYYSEWYNPNIIPSIVNNTLTGKFLLDVCILHVFDINDINCEATLNSKRLNTYSNTDWVANKLAFDVVLLTTQINDLTNKIADLEKRTNYVENNRAWW